MGAAHHPFRRRNKKDLCCRFYLWHHRRMKEVPDSNIRRLVEHHNGPTNVARMLEGLTYQEVSAWVARGWASPMHALQLEKIAPEGMDIRDLLSDREVVRAQEAA